MNKVKVLFSGITGRTGKELLNLVKTQDKVEIVAGVCRNDIRYYNYNELDKITEDFDIIVDFSHKDSFDKILLFALENNKPLIIGTSKLSEEQIKNIQEASKIIPIFNGGNFRFEVQEFIENVLEYAKNTNDKLVLIETHYKTKKIPSETAKGLAKRIYKETGKELEIKSFLEYDELINDYKIGNLHCRSIGFKPLAEGILKIAAMIKEKDNGIYTFEKLLKEEK